MSRFTVSGNKSYWDNLPRGAVLQSAVGYNTSSSSKVFPNSYHQWEEVPGQLRASLLPTDYRNNFHVEARVNWGGWSGTTDVAVVFHIMYSHDNGTSWYAFGDSGQGTNNYTSSGVRTEAGGTGDFLRGRDRAGSYTPSGTMDYHQAYYYAWWRPEFHKNFTYQKDSNGYIYGSIGNANIGSVVHGGLYRYNLGDGNASVGDEVLLVSDRLDSHAQGPVPVIFAVMWGIAYSSARTVYWNRSIGSGNSYNPISTCSIQVTESKAV